MDSTGSRQFQDWPREQGDYEEDDSDAHAAEALAESLCTCHGCWPRSDTAYDALASLRNVGSYRASFDEGFAVFEVRYTCPEEPENSS